MGWFKRRSGSERRAEKTEALEVEVNGKAKRLQVDPSKNLLQVLRRKLDLVRFPGDCGRGDCGGCMVLIDDQPRLACMTPASEVAGRSIVTAEGLLDPKSPSTIPEAFQAHEVFFCGGCTSGQMMAAEGLLRADPDPTPQAILEALSAVDCSCGGQHLFYAAVERAVELKKDRMEGDRAL